MNASKEQIAQIGYAACLLGMLIALFMPAFKLIFGGSQEASDSLLGLIGISEKETIMNSFQANTLGGIVILVCIVVGFFFSFIKFNKVAIVVAPIVGLGLAGYEYVKVGQSAVFMGVSGTATISVLPGFYVLIACAIIATILGIIVALSVKE